MPELYANRWETSESIPFFMGNEYKIQVEKLCVHYGKEYGFHREVQFDQELYLRLMKHKAVYFRFEGIILKEK